MPESKTGGNPVITESDEIWAAVARIDRQLEALTKMHEHTDQIVHRIDQALAPLREHEDAVARGLARLDSFKMPGWMGGGKPKPGGKS